MSQNFSKMSNLYIPELIELDSYWQKAVEDAIYDTLKGEKRLYYALRNRKKINRKLERLGLKPVYSHMSFANRYHSYVKSNNMHFQKSLSNMDWDCCCQNSGTTIYSNQDDDFCSEGAEECNLDSNSGFRSRSRSKSARGTPPEKSFRNPDRPLLGDGSLEKMKKSQNSFNCEPMGVEKNVLPSLSESEGEEMMEDEDMNLEDEGLNKKIKWLHVREDSIFEESDTEVSNKGISKEIIENDGFQKRPTVKDKNYFMHKKLNLSSSSTASQPKSNGKKFYDQKIPMALDPQKDLFLENGVKNPVNNNAALDQKLHLALAKRDIVNQNSKTVRTENSSSKILIEESLTKNSKKKIRNKKCLPPFVKFYLEVYKELCHKYPVKQIGVEAANRWWEMTVNQKTSGNKNRRKYI